jgi:hypothetical protein
MSVRDFVSRWWPGGQAARAQQAKIEQFRDVVRTAGEGADRTGLQGLGVTREALGLTEDDVAIELELAEAYLEVLDLEASVSAEGLAVVETTHRVVGPDTCYFIAPAFSADRPDEPGKVFLTNRRIVFAAGRVITVGWGSVSAVRESQRDLVIAANGGQLVHQFRFNSFVDTKRCAFIAQRLKAHRS